MLVSCIYCGGLHKRGTECPKKPVVDKKGTKMDKFRWSKPWQKKRKEVNERDKYLCKVCLQEGKYTYIDLSVHHIDSLLERWDRRLDDFNLITLCREHHEEAERGKIEKEYLFKLVEVIEED